MLVNSTTPQIQETSNEQLCHLERQFVANRQKINDWFETQWQSTPPPVYGSVDLRNAGFKLAPIDMNLFPAGFNNLNPQFLSDAINAAKKTISNIAPGIKKLLIVPESHTRNLFYWANVKTLQTILEQAGFEVRFGLLSGVEAPQTIDLPAGGSVSVEPLQRTGSQLHVRDFVPELVLLNNDLSEGIPEILQQVDQRIVPPAELGWSMRLKSEHFQYYAFVAGEFAELLGIDSWLIAPLFRHCGDIDFMQQDGMECLIANAEILFEAIQKKYDQYGIKQQPFLIVKADAGTYGMAVMTVRNVEELKAMNRKQRTRMATTKGGQTVNRVIIQEGVYTFETWGPDAAVAEPVVYLWGSCVVGGFYRVHQGRGVDESLNSPGMQFEPLAFSQACDAPCEELEPDACPNRFFTYGIIAKLSMLAAAREMKEWVK